MADQGAGMMANAEESTLPVETIDIHAWKAEETNRENEKKNNKRIIDKISNNK